MEINTMLLIERKFQPQMPFKKEFVDVKANIVLEKMGSTIILFAPGFNKKQVSLKIEKSSIVIEGLIDEVQSTDKFLHKEFLVKSFNRSFQVSDEFDLNLVAATMEDGVLKIQIPRKENENQNKQITIQ